MSQDALRVAAVQLCSQDDVTANLEACRAEIERAASLGAKLVLLPENFAYFGAEEGRRRIAERIGDVDAPIQAALSRASRAHGLTIVAGGMPEVSEDPSRTYNTCVVVAPSGSVVASYRKIHLFDVELPDGTKLRESSTTAAGTSPVVASVEGFEVGLSICYDLRFPELYRRLVDRGASLLVVPAAFTLLTGKDHWHALLRARAIESQSWVVAAGQWGKHPLGRTTYGHSMIVDPWGTIVAEASDRVGVVVAEVDHGLVERVRSSLPTLRHRKL
jgi:deaminated glutathione amidase